MGFDLDRLRLAEEEHLLRHLESVLSADLINTLLDALQAKDEDRTLSVALKEHLLPITERIAPQLFRACQDSIAALGYQAKRVEFFLSNTPEVNAAAILNQDRNDCHIVILNAGLVEPLEDAELRFVVGHELGHLVFEHSRLSRIARLVYPDVHRMPTYLLRRYNLWTKLGEMGCDRLGLLAAGNFDAAARAVLKTSCGMSIKHFGNELLPYLELVDSLIKEFGEQHAADLQSHPGNPLRVKALQLFGESQTFAAWSRGEDAGVDEVLEERMGELTHLMKYLPAASWEQAALDFLAGAGLLLVRADGKGDERELDCLLNLLSRHSDFAPALIDEIGKGDEAEKLMRKAAEFLVSEYPEKARGIMDALLPVIFRDGNLAEPEVLVFVKIATEEMKIPTIEAIHMIVEGLKSMFAPME